MIKRLAIVMVVMAALNAVGARPATRSGFERVPKQALVELKATVGKPFTSGLVFIDGRFIEPPYKVERFGTAMRINGQQVTGQVIPWSEFLKTQEGVSIEKTETVPETPAAAEVEEPEPEEPVDTADSLDDLFSDDPAPKKTTPVRRKVAPRPAAPVQTVTVSFDGEFKTNEKVRQMVDQLNKYRAKLEVTLRKGGYIFFGTRYSSVIGDRGTVDLLMKELPMVMKRNSEYPAFASAARAKGIIFLPEIVLGDLFRNRLDYLRLQERAKKMEEERQWNALMNKAL